MTKYLDTSAVGDAIVGPPEREAAVLAAIGGDDTLTSTYVREQFRKAFLGAAVGAHALVADSQTLGEANKRLGESFAKRDMARQAAWLGEVLDNVDTLADAGELHDAGRREAALSLLEAYIDEDIMDRFRQLAPGHEAFAATGCCQAIEDPTYDEETGIYEFRPHCSKADPRSCAISEFLQDHASEVEALADGSDELEEANASKQYALRECAAAARERSDTFRGMECWVGLSDAIIAMECPSDAGLCATDKDFGPICSCLGREWIDARPKKPRARKVAKRPRRKRRTPPGA